VLKKNLSGMPDFRKRLFQAKTKKKGKTIMDKHEEFCTVEKVENLKIPEIIVRSYSKTTAI
jgi:hypothetical protein